MHVDARARVRCASGSTYKVERAVDLVKLGSEDGGEEIGHGDDVCWAEEAVMGGVGGEAWGRNGDVLEVLRY